MSSAENETTGVFVEDDSAETRFAYDEGGVPLYVGLVWIGFIISLITFLLVYFFPDLASWFGQ